MRTKYVALVLLITLALQGYSQEPNVSWGKEIKSVSGEEKFSGILGTHNSEYFFVRESGPIYGITYKIERYSSAFEKIYSKEIPTALGIAGDNLLYSKVMLNQDKILVFYDGWKKAEKKSTFNVQVYNVNLEKQGEIKNLVSIAADKQINSGHSYVSISPDKTKILIQTNLPFVKDSKEKVLFSVFESSTCKQLWSKEISLQNTAEKNVLNETAIDNNGTVYMLKTYYLPKNAQTYSLFVCSNNGQNWVEQKLALSNAYLSDYKLQFNSKQDFTISGFYSTQDDESAGGTYYCRVDKTSLKIVNQQSTAFSEQILSNFMLNKSAAKPNAVIKNLKIKDIFGSTSGGSVIIAERMYESSKNIAVAGEKPNYEYSADYNNILVVHVTPEGLIKWGTVIKKQQSLKSSDSKFDEISCTYSYVNDKVYILWNNIQLNVLTVPPLKWVDHKGVQYVQRKNFNEKVGIPVFMHVVDASGTLLYASSDYGMPLFSLYNNSATSVYMNSNVFLPLADGIIIIGQSAKKGGVYKIGKISL